MEPKISNITATAQVANELNLKKLARRMWNVEYNPRKFNALIVRTRHPKITALVFHTGKMVIIGAKSQEESLNGGKKVAKLLRRAGGKQIKMKEFRIQNIVASAQVNYRIDLETLCFSKPALIYYEPELFSPACKIRFSKEDGNLTALVFRTGKLIYTGSVDCSKINDFHSYLRRLLLKYRQQLFY
jgi:transcription initiation factor TFIID TATA-box-binding protein